ncbi:MAG: Uma2 family endonuclease [Pirellulaceae bacterium]|nr:Uma2 family endonuclease [Pirellulaceae bacterium]
MSAIAHPARENSVALHVPRLENGDHLTREEFNRRWDAMPDLQRAELIEGVVFMGAALRHKQHGDPHRRFIGWMDRYAAYTPGIDGGIAGSVEMDDWNEPQPDCYLFLPPALGSKVVVTDEGYLAGAPDLIAEISAYTASIDLHRKKDVYQRHGVREYIVWRVLEETIDWFVLDELTYTPLLPDQDGVIRSPLFPGLWLDVAAMLRGPAQRVHEVLDQGLATPEHAAFVQLLAPHVKP